MHITQSRALRVAAFSPASPSTPVSPSRPRHRASPGTWSPVGSDCTVTDGAIQLTPRTLVADEVACKFAGLPVRDGQPSPVAAATSATRATRPTTLRRTGTRLTLAYDNAPP